MSKRIRLGAMSSLAIVVAVGLSACSEIVDGESEVINDLSAEEMSAFVPTASITVDDGAFARMVASPAEDIEIPATLTLWRAGRSVVNDKDVELQIKGGLSAGLPSKSLGVKFDRAFRNRDNDFMIVPHLDPAHRLERIKSFRLRNGGSSFETTLIKDLAYARMVAASDLEVVCMYGEPAATYVNGRFYALQNLRTENNLNGLSRLLDIDEDRLGVAAVDDSMDELDVKGGDEAMWRQLEGDVARGDTAAVLAAVDQRGFADFIIAGAFFATQDWPWRNVRLYRVDGGPVGFVLYDFDFAGQAFTNRSPYAYIERGRDGLIRRMFMLCYGDASFRDLLEHRYDNLRESGQLSPARLREVVEPLVEAYESVIGYQVAKYGFPESRAAWFVGLEALIGDYALRYDRLPTDFK